MSSLGTHIPDGKRRIMGEASLLPLSGASRGKRFSGKMSWSSHFSAFWSTGRNEKTSWSSRFSAFWSMGRHENLAILWCRKPYFFVQIRNTTEHGTEVTWYAFFSETTVVWGVLGHRGILILSLQRYCNSPEHLPVFVFGVWLYCVPTRNVNHSEDRILAFKIGCLRGPWWSSG